MLLSHDIVELLRAPFSRQDLILLRHEVTLQNLRTERMAVHLASTSDIGSRAAVEAPARRPDGTWNIKLTVAVFRPWRGSQATIASDPAFNAAPRFAHPRRRLSEEFDPAIAGCWLQGTANSPSSTTKPGADGQD